MTMFLFFAITVLPVNLVLAQMTLEPGDNFICIHISMASYGKCNGIMAIHVWTFWQGWRSGNRPSSRSEAARTHMRVYANILPIPSILP